MPSSVRFLYSAREVRYKIRLSGAYLSCLSGCDIAGSTAVLTVFVAIAFKLLSAMVTGKLVIGSSIDILLMTVPPCHTTGIGAEFLLPTAFWLPQRFAAVLAGLGVGDIWMTMDVRTNGSFG